MGASLGLGGPLFQMLKMIAIEGSSGAGMRRTSVQTPKIHPQNCAAFWHLVRCSMLSSWPHFSLHLLSCVLADPSRLRFEPTLVMSPRLKV